MKRYLYLLILLLCIPAFATNYTVKAGGGGNFTTIAACMTQMSTNGTGVADTCTVFSGTYNESPSVPAGSVGVYKTVNVNGSDVVSVLGFTLHSHTQLIGNCPTFQGTVTTATCGFFISNPSSPTSTCVALPASTTDAYIRFNTMYACGGIGASYPTQVSFIYIQGNTESYTNSTVGTVPTSCGGSGQPVGNSINLYGDHFLVENNDFSHYTLSLNWNPQNSITRNNSFHDQIEVNNAGNCHSDTWFSDPGGTNLVNNQANVYEGNSQRNGQGANAKGPLFQAPSCTGCNIAIIRFNVTNRIGSGSTTNDQNWKNVKVYNNTTADANADAGTTGLETDNSQDSNPPTPSVLNQIYYYSRSGIVDVSPGTCGNSNSCNFGHNLAFCVAGCTTIYGHSYQSGLFTADPGNKVANPLFVNYVGAGNASNDYHLQAGSPAIAAGTNLTTVANTDTGSGTSLIVSDATYFQDGYGLTNAFSTVNGDCIAVTTVGNHVCITAVNYSTNTLTLAGSISRSHGDPVWLYNKSDGVQVLTGSAPDMGAYPFVNQALSNAVLAPSSFDFSNQAVGIPTVGQVFTLSNTGGADLSITSIAFTGTNSTDFSKTTDCTSVLSAGDTCTITVIFTPGATGSRSGNLVITDDSGGVGGSTQTSTLTGTGVAITLTPTSQNFGGTPLGSTSGIQTFTLSNGTASNLNVTNVSVNNTDFNVVLGGSCPGEFGFVTPVLPFSSCTINVVFNPVAVGARAGTLTVIDNGAGSPRTSSLTGTGLSGGLMLGHAIVKGHASFTGSTANQTACGPPLYSCFNFSTDLINYSNPGPNFGSNNCDWTSAFTVQLCGNLTGANTAQTPADFGNTIIRVTDKDTVSGSPQFTWTTYDSASINAWASDDTAFLVKVTSSGNQYLFTWNPTTLQTALLTNTGTPVTFNGNAWFAHTTPTASGFPLVPVSGAACPTNASIYWYDGTTGTQLKGSCVNYSTGAVNTATLFDFNTSSCLLNTVNGINSPTPPTWDSGTTYPKWFVVVSSGVTYTSRVNSNLNHTPVSSPTQWAVGFSQDGWTGTGASDLTDTQFTRGFSNSGGQGTGGYLASWAVGQGASSCDLWNTETNVVSHNGSSVGTVSNTPWGGANGGLFDEFDMHEAIQTPNLGWATADTTTNSMLFGTTNNGNYDWQIGTTNVQVCGISAPNWKASTSYSGTGNRISPLTNNSGMYIYQIVNGVGGTSGGTAPTWNQTPGSDTTDGPLTWHNVGLGTAQKYFCDGHGITQYFGAAYGKKITYHSYASPITPQTALLPTNAQSNVADQHFGNPNANNLDSLDVFAMSAAVGTGVQLMNTGVQYPSPYFNELYLLTPINKPDGTPNCAYDVNTCPNGYGFIRRVVHTYNSGWHRVFDVQNAFTIISQTGKFALMSSDAMGQLGNIDGTHAACNVGAPDWIKSATGDGTTTYTAGYKLFPNPASATNAGPYIYQIQSCSGACQTGATEPTWVQNTTVAGLGTFTDGTITWQGAPDVNTPANTAIQNCRADVFVVKMFR